MTIEYSGAFVIALVLSATLPIVLIRLLLRARAIDIPSSRSSHSMPAVRGLGAGVAVAMGTAACAAWALDVAAVGPAGLVIAGGGAAAVIGLVEDVRGIGTARRVLLQVLLGSAVGASFAFLPGSENFGTTISLVLFAAVVFSVLINVTNFMDGVDGISSLHAIVTGAAFVVSSILWGQPWLTLVGVILAGGFLGFLPWNLGRRGSFLGDSGSYLLGATVAGSIVLAVTSGVPVLAVVSPIAVYLVDTTSTLIRRMANAERWTEAHRSHVYQRLADTGLSHLRIAAVVSAFSSVAAVVGIAGAFIGGWGEVLAFAIILGLGAIYARLPRLRGWRHSPDPGVEPPVSALGGVIPSASELTVAVFGSSGFVGSAVVDELTRSSIRVIPLPAPRLVSRSSDLDGLLLDLEALSTERDQMRTVLEGVDVVVNAAGVAAPDGVDTGALFGGNALLPALILRASDDAAVQRVVHISSAAVQGRRPVLDESASHSPFSLYSRSKALGEQAVFHLASGSPDRGAELVVIRATSVQGTGRGTTRQLQRIAASPFSSIAGRAGRPTVVSSITGLSVFVRVVASHQEDLPTVMVQPSEGLLTDDVLRAAGGREPRRLPEGFCRTVVGFGYILGAIVPRITGIVRRIEVMWFGQQQDASWARAHGLDGVDRSTTVLRQRVCVS